MASQLIVMAAMCGAVLSEIQPLHKVAVYTTDVGVSETQQDKIATNHTERNVRYVKPFCHRKALLVSAASAEPFQPANTQKLYNANAERGPSTLPWAVETANEAAAEMLSRHLAQCLPVVTYTGEEKGLESLISAMDAAGVPRLLLLRRRSLSVADRKGEGSHLLVLSSRIKTVM